MPGDGSVGSRDDRLRLPPRPRMSRITETATTMPIAIAHSLFGALVVASGRVAEVGVEAEPDHDHDRADHLAATDVLLRQEVAERQREDDRRDEQRLDDRDPATIERTRLEDVAGEERERSEQPPRLPDEAQERLRVGERDLREVERPLLLQRCRKREEERRDECEDCQPPAQTTTRVGRWQLASGPSSRGGPPIPCRSAADRPRRIGVSPNADAAVDVEPLELDGDGGERTRGAPTTRARAARRGVAASPGSTSSRRSGSRSRRGRGSPRTGGRASRVGACPRRRGTPSARRGPAVRPIRPSVSSRWSITCTAVVGSLTAGESARIATSTRMRSAKAGSWSIVRSIPSASLPASRRSAILGKGAVAVHLEQHGIRGDEVADAVPHHDHRVVVGRPREQALVIDRLERTRLAGCARRASAPARGSSSSSASAPERRRVVASSTVPEARHARRAPRSRPP